MNQPDSQKRPFNAEQLAWIDKHYSTAYWRKSGPMVKVRDK